MVICLLGIFAHVLRKSLKSEPQSEPLKHLNLSSDSEDEDFFRPRAKSSQSPILPKEGFPLLGQIRLKLLRLKKILRCKTTIFVLNLLYF